MRHVKRWRLQLLTLCSLLLLSFFSSELQAQTGATTDTSSYGPYNGVFLFDGDGLEKKISEHDSLLRADSPWSLYCWIQLDEPPSGPTLVAGVGDPNEEYPRYLEISRDKLTLFAGKQNKLDASASFAPGKWHLIAATFDGSDFKLFSDGRQLASGKLRLGSVTPVLEMAPPAFPLSDGTHFGGKIAGLTLIRDALSAEQIRKLGDNPGNLLLAPFEEGSKSWKLQTRGQAGYRAPQDPGAMPRSRAAIPSQPGPLYGAKPERPTSPLEADGDNQWKLGAWKLVAAPDVNASGEELSRAGVDTRKWMDATVPGTVLTTMVDRGVYPDPDFGLNNLAIPESLNKQDYWYRTEFKSPTGIAGRKLTLTFHGINYRAQVWLNGQLLGAITGAFIRGVFDVTSVMKPNNVLAVRVSPPPHPGIPQEQSIKGGPGENGGAMCLDGPTFVATEGWDWIPAIRDRNTGIWQPVTLSASGSVKIGDPQVVTSLPLPNTSRADVLISVPVENAGDKPIHGTLKASFDNVAVTKEATVPPGKSEIKLTPSEFSQLTVQHPRLWWPNGYGKQELYDLELSFSGTGNNSDTKHVRFGIREITYELSLFDSRGHLRRLEYSPTIAMQKAQRVVDVSHDGMREIPPADPLPPEFPKDWKEWWKSWVASLAPGGETSPAVKPLDDKGMTPYLVVKVNGVRIACRGGNWGMDDSRKRVSRERLEPYFKLHHDANVNIIRNWVGQNTEQTFYDLADEYGLLVWNDFWESTQDYNIEAQDPVLFLDNARDTILRFRNHPSIVMWCGRNEGVPQPIINEGLHKLVRTLDGTRYYSPSSNQVNLQNSGPYKYMDPVLYYTALNHGFSVETGTPSFSTLESFRDSIPKEDQWPIDDLWAYHDWHMSGNGDMAPFMSQIEKEFGAATSLEDFERKAQMLNYVDHRAIFEGMNQHLWAPNSGRLLWMTQPAWPSNTWQIISHDYDTQASFYATKKACEPLHVQLDLSNFSVTIVNTTVEPRSGLTASAKVYSLDNKLLLQKEDRKDVAADGTADVFRLDLQSLFSNGVLLVKLELRDSSAKLVSDNFYWLAADAATYQRMAEMPMAAVKVTRQTAAEVGGATHEALLVENTGGVAAVEVKLTLLNAGGRRVLPAYYSDNYISLLPGEKKELSVDYASREGQGPTHYSIRGWNVAPTLISEGTH